MSLNISYWEACMAISGLGLLLIGVAYLRKKMRIVKESPEINVNYIQPETEPEQNFVRLLEAESEKALQRIQQTAENEKMQLLHMLGGSGIEEPSQATPFQNHTPPSNTDDPYENARHYAGMGVSAQEIAVSLGIPLAEAELAVKLTPLH